MMGALVEHRAVGREVVVFPELSHQHAGIVPEAMFA
jgi:hypothetical protein